jgi:hypothetical protein
VLELGYSNIVYSLAVAVNINILLELWIRVLGHIIVLYFKHQIGVNYLAYCVIYSN